MRLSADLSLGNLCRITVLIILRPLDHAPAIKIIDNSVFFVILTVKIKHLFHWLLST